MKLAIYIIIGMILGAVVLASSALSAQPFSPHRLTLILAVPMAGIVHEERVNVVTLSLREAECVFVDGPREAGKYRAHNYRQDDLTYYVDWVCTPVAGGF